jgi:hypothetical protein
MKLILVDKAGFAIKRWDVSGLDTSRKQEWTLILIDILKAIDDYNESVADRDFEEAERSKR